MFSYLLIKKKEVKMKKLLQFSHSKFLTLKTGWLLAIAFTMATVFTGCKKDFPSPCHDGDSFNGKAEVSLCIRVGLSRLLLMRQHRAQLFL